MTQPALITSRPPIVLTIDGLPQPKGNKTAYKRGNKVVLVEGRRKEAREAGSSWREAVADAARRWLADNGRPAPIDDPIAVTIAFRLPRPSTAAKRVTLPARKPDADKLCRHVLDALEGLLYTNDSRIVDLYCKKRFAIGEPPGATIMVEVLA